MKDFTPFKHPDEIVNAYNSKDAPRYFTDRNTNVPINLTPEDHEAMRLFSVMNKIPLSWLIRHAFEQVYRPALDVFKRRYE